LTDQHAAYFRALIERASDMILVLDADGHLVYESPSNARHLGYPRGELIGRYLPDLLHMDDREEGERALAELRANPGAVVDRELRCLAGTGEWCHLELSGRNLLDVPAVRGIVLNARDVTRRRRLESELMRAQKMEAVGRLAGGITHDFNNLLTTVEGNALLLLDRIGPDVDGADELRDIINAAQRATALTRSLLAISRNQAVNTTDVDVNAVVLDMQSMLRRTIPENIALVTMLAPLPSRVRLGEGQFEQIVLNLVLNARDALQAGGRIEIQTTVEPARSAAWPDGAEAWVLLTVRDDGTGMDAATSAHVFEPFFTTKPAGYGTGLGLATVFGIAAQAGGDVDVQSAPGAGTVVSVRLPRVASAAPEPAPPASPCARQSASTASGGTILLVEDEAAVRGLAHRILSRLGYTVLEAEDGVAALRTMRQHDGGIDLVLTDVVMPGIGGIELARRVAAERPETRVLFMSGYSTDAIERAAPHGAALIEKPFTPDMLAGRVRQALSPRQHGVTRP
jgi:two-component system, cell cycle sensor histidine kinase and response regulator CckA